MLLLCVLDVALQFVHHRTTATASGSDGYFSSNAQAQFAGFRDVGEIRVI
jgi:hypothetical protein